MYTLNLRPKLDDFTKTHVILRLMLSDSTVPAPQDFSNTQQTPKLLAQLPEELPPCNLGQMDLWQLL